MVLGSIGPDAELTPAEILALALGQALDELEERPIASVPPMRVINWLELRPRWRAQLNVVPTCDQISLGPRPRWDTRTLAQRPTTPNSGKFEGMSIYLSF